MNREYISELRHELATFEEELVDRMGLILPDEPRDQFLIDQIDKLRRDLDNYHRSNPDWFEHT